MGIVLGRFYEYKVTKDFAQTLNPLPQLRENNRNQVVALGVHIPKSGGYEDADRRGLNLGAICSFFYSFSSHVNCFRKVYEYKFN